MPMTNIVAPWLIPSLYLRSQWTGLRAKTYPSIIGYFNESVYGGAITPSQARDIIKKEILLFGPVNLDFEVEEEFYFYHSGV